MPEKAKVSIEPNFGAPIVSKPVIAKTPVPVPVKKIIKKVVKKTVIPTPAPQEKKRAKVQTLAQYLENESGDGSDVPLERRNKQLLIIGVIVATLISIATSAIFYFRLGVTTGDIAEEEEQEELVEEAEDVKVVEEPVQKDEKEIDVLNPAEITLEILNGSGVSGLAGDAQLEFEELGYIVESIGTAEEEIVESELYISEEVELEELEKLLRDVNRRLNIEKVTGTLTDLEVTARIILGSE